MGENRHKAKKQASTQLTIFIGQGPCSMWKSLYHTSSSQIIYHENIHHYEYNQQSLRHQVLLMANNMGYLYIFGSCNFYGMGIRAKELPRILPACI